MHSDRKPTSDEVIISSICNNMYMQNLRYGTVCTGSYGVLDDIKWARSGHPALNYVLGASLNPKQARDRVAEITEMVKAWGVNALWQIGPEASPSDVFDLAVDCGWTPASQTTGMAIKEGSLVPDVPMPDGLTISAADDEESLRVWVDIYFTAAPQEYRNTVAGVICELGHGPHLPWTYYIGYLNGTAVASSMVFVGADVAGLYYIGTLPDYRQQGIGTAMTHYSLKQAQSLGYDLVVLQATDMGANIYRDLGFQNCCRIRTLVLRTQA